jgi:hypothetical protein
MVPFFGQAGNYLIARNNDKPYDDKLNTSPVVPAVERAIFAPATAYDAIFGDGKASAAIKDNLNLLGMALNLPLGQLGKPLGYVADVIQGEQDADGVGQIARGLVTGRAEPRSN